jgi:5-oxoprolinase (ATP-hydrolysing) subunit C
MIEILSETALATVQDLGRFGALGFGVGNSGAMDDLALAAGNILLANDETDAGVEVQIFPFAVRFHTACAFAVTGADCAATLDGRAVLPWWSHQAQAGQVLRLSTPAASAWKASRAYLCVAGGIDAPMALGSRSTQLRGAFGGHHGRALLQGDLLKAAAPGDRIRRVGFGLVPPEEVDPLLCDGLAAMRVIPAAEYERFDVGSLAAFWGEPWKITPQSDRYGYRLAGPTLSLCTALELRSHGIVPGVIQVPPGGQPIIQMRDAQPSGGYPKIGTVIAADLWRLGQAPIGSKIRFVRCDWNEAIAAEARNRDYLDKVRRLTALYRSQMEKS